MGVASFRLNGEPSDAERCISEGLKLAREQNAKSLELKLYVTFCDLYPGGDARSHLIPALRNLVGSFNGGCDNLDLIKARKILEGSEMNICKPDSRKKRQ